MARRGSGFSLIAAALLLAACGEAEEAGGLSRDERAQLNDAAAMLEANAMTLDDDEAGGND